MINKFLTEAMGECWHHEGETVADAKHYVDFYTCSKCHKTWKYRLNFSTWQGYGKLWEWAQKQEWWKEFALDKLDARDICGCGDCCDIRVDPHWLIPDLFPDAVYNFLVESTWQAKE